MRSVPPPPKLQVHAWPHLALPINWELAINEASIPYYTAYNWGITTWEQRGVATLSHISSKALQDPFVCVQIPRVKWP